MEHRLPFNEVAKILIEEIRAARGSENITPQERVLARLCVLDDPSNFTLEQIVDIFEEKNIDPRRQAQKMVSLLSGKTAAYGYTLLKPRPPQEYGIGTIDPKTNN